MVETRSQTGNHFPGFRTHGLAQSGIMDAIKYLELRYHRVMRRWDSVSIRCPAQTAHQDEQPPKPPRENQAEVRGLELVIGRTDDDTSRDFDKRAFAPLGLSSDREADKTSWDVDPYLGTARPSLGAGGEIAGHPSRPGNITPRKGRRPLLAVR